MPSHLIVDIETVPDHLIYEPEAVQPPAWAAALVANSISQGRPADAKIPPPWACRVVVMGVVWLGEDLRLLRIGAMGEKIGEKPASEGEILRGFSSFMAAQEAQVVTWAGRTFDLPVVVMRSFRAGVPMPWYYKVRDYRYRYTADGHLDLCDYLADFGGGRLSKLDGVARAIGLPGKDGASGGDVHELWDAGRFSDVRNYCLTDVVQTAFVFLRYKLLVGHLDYAFYRRAAQGLLKGCREDVRVEGFFGEGRVDEDLLLLQGEHAPPEKGKKK